MSFVDFRPGSIVYHKNRSGRVLAILDLEYVLIRPETGEEPYRALIQELRSSLPHEKEQYDLMSVKDEDWLKAQERFAIIQPILAQSPHARTRNFVAERAEAFNLNAATLYRWIANYCPPSAPMAQNWSCDLRRILVSS